LTYRDDDRRLADIQQALDAIDRHLRRGTVEDELPFDACRTRLIEIGEAVKALSDGLKSHEPSIPWREIARMRDHLTHRYFDTQHEIVADVVTNDLAPLRAAVERLRGTIEEDRPSGAR
jgi:uncharacterized protein with HEPN domain